MNTFHLEKDIEVYYVSATSFPDGVLAAHQALHKLAEYDPKRKYFGISRPENGKIIYKAAAEELHKSEFSAHKLPHFTIPKGDYLYLDVKEFMKDIPAIGIAFQKLIADKRIDPNGYCIEWYLSQNDCRCLVKMA